MLRTLCVFLIIGLLFILGCSDNSLNNQTSYNPDDFFGGYTQSPEPVAFDDPDIKAIESSDAAFSDVVLASPEMVELYRTYQLYRYHLRIVWGQLPYDSSATNPTDWIGSLTVSRGGIVLKRLINWELNQDFIAERNDRHLVQWKSQTTVHNDGLAVDLFIPPPMPNFDTTISYDYDTSGDSVEVIVIDTVYSEDDRVVVSLDLGGYSRRLGLLELNTLDTFVRLDDGNAIALHAMRIDNRSCPSGFLSGIFGNNEAGEQILRGLWLNESGRLKGYYKGHWETNDTDGQFFVGKLIGRDGRFVGFIRGHFETEEIVEPNGIRIKGHFRGHIYSADRRQIGKLAGRYMNRNNERGGLMIGRWKFVCPPLTGDEIDDGF